MLFGWSDGNFMESFMNLEAYNVFEAKKICCHPCLYVQFIHGRGSCSLV